MPLHDFFLLPSERQYKKTVQVDFEAGSDEMRSLQGIVFSTT